MKIVVSHDVAEEAHNRFHELGLHHDAPEMDLIDGDLIGRENIEFNTNESLETIEESLGYLDIEFEIYDTYRK
jgi:hypothetical protein